MPDPLAAQVTAELLRDVISLRFRPGQMLSENELAQEYGVSRTPVREAVQRLRRAGLVEVRPQSGTFVSKVDLARFREAQFVRETLETACIDLALTRTEPVPKAALAAMRREITAQRRAATENDTRTFVEHDEEMHRIVCSLSGHDGVWDTISEVKLHLDRVRHMSLVTPRVMLMLTRQHRRIVDGIAARDREAALAAARTHTRETLRVLPDLMETYPSWFDGAPGRADTA